MWRISHLSAYVIGGALLAACDRPREAAAPRDPGSPGTTSPVAAAAPTSRPRVLIQTLRPRWGLSPEAIAEIARDVPEVEVITGVEDELPGLIPSADAFLGVPRKDLVAQGVKLRWVHVFSAGVDEVLHPEMMERPIALTNAKIIQGPEIADHAMGLLLALARGLHRAVRRRELEEWRPLQYEPIELRGKTAVLVGLGGIGIQIAERAAAHGMRVIGVDAGDVPYHASLSRILRPEGFRDALAEADVLFLAAPLTPSTRGLVSRDELARMRRGAYLVNVSRGPLVDTAALVEALEGGQLAGAGLDVTDPEPLPRGHPLWKLDNVIITPHIAGVSDGAASRKLELVKDNVRRFASGLPLRNLVDKARGY